MKSKAVILLIFLLVILASFVTQKSSARQSTKIKDTTRMAPSVSVRERFLGTWELVSTEYRYTDGTRRPYPDVGPHGKGYLMYALGGHVCAQAPKSGPAGLERSEASDGRGENLRLRRIFCVLRKI
jgi:hypothetical protein